MNRGFRNCRCIYIFVIDLSLLTLLCTMFIFIVIKLRWLLEIFNSIAYTNWLHFIQNPFIVWMCTLWYPCVHYDSSCYQFRSNYILFRSLFDVLLFSIVHPLRPKHCYDCGKCVLGFDHHCVWLGTYIGEGNHRRFW